jgi:hypothetical protein
MWYDHATQKCSGMAPTGGTNERLWDSTDMRAYAAAEVAKARAAEREQLRGGNDLDAMCEAFHRLIEAYAVGQNPFHQPIAADAQTALRVLRGVANGLKAG